MTQIRFIFLTSALMVVGIFGFGCGGGKPNPVSSNISYGPDDEFATRILDRSERREVISIMQASVVGPTDDPAHPARYGVRWRDVHAAAIAAGAPLELAVLSLEANSENTMKTVELMLPEQPLPEDAPTELDGAMSWAPWKVKKRCAQIIHRLLQAPTQSLPAGHMRAARA